MLSKDNSINLEDFRARDEKRDILTKDGAAERLLDAIEQLCLKKAVKP